MHLIGQEFAGQIISGDDPMNRGRYCVLIQELMHNIYDQSEGYIYCVNHVGNYRNTNSDNGIYGQYFPLQPGTKVIVKFFTNDLETGYIDRIISDYYPNSQPLGIPSEDRDQYYQLLRTVANDLIAITGNTTSGALPANSMVFYHKGSNVKVSFDPDGIHIYTKKSLDVQIDEDAYAQIDGDTDVMLGGDLQVSISGDNKISISGDSHLTVTGNISISTSGDHNLIITGQNNISVMGNNNLIVGGDCKITAGGNCDIKSTGNCNIDTATCNIKSSTSINLDSSSGININCGLAPSLPGASPGDASSANQLLMVANNLQSTSEQIATVSSNIDKVSTSLSATKLAFST